MAGLFLKLKEMYAKDGGKPPTHPEPDLALPHPGQALARRNC
jgi:hypothetical protein